MALPAAAWRLLIRAPIDTATGLAAFERLEALSGPPMAASWPLRASIAGTTFCTMGVAAVEALAAGTGGQHDRLAGQDSQRRGFRLPESPRYWLLGVVISDFGLLLVVSFWRTYHPHRALDSHETLGRAFHPLPPAWLRIRPASCSRGACRWAASRCFTSE